MKKRSGCQESMSITSIEPFNSSFDHKFDRERREKESLENKKKLEISF